jgi:acetyltransferase-like isoleucine patch superfamily enzyme
MTPVVVHLTPFLVDQRLFGLSVPAWWAWLCRTAGLEAALVVGPPDATPADAHRPGTLRIDGRWLGVETADLAELDEHDGVLAAAATPDGPVVVIACGATSQSRLGAPARSLRRITLERGLRCVEDEDALAATEDTLRHRKAAALQRAGVRVVDPARTWIAPTVAVEPGARIWPDVTLLGWTTIGAGAELMAGVHLSDCRVGARSLLRPYTVGEGAVLGEDTKVGPFAHLRPGTELGDEVHVGNFVETKEAKLGAGAKANHLTYLGDCEVGEGSNIGAGTITCNYDGARKHRTVIGARTFVGTHTSLVAPVEVGDEALIAAGSVIVTPVPDGALAISRATQANIPGKGKQILDRNRALRALQARPAASAHDPLAGLFAEPAVIVLPTPPAPPPLPPDGPTEELARRGVLDDRVGMPTYDPPTHDEEPG